MLEICSKFPITIEEYALLDKKFGQLVEYIAWQLIKKNTRNSHTDEQQDVAQELKIALIRAGSYYKRQVYVELCLELCEKYAKDKFTNLVVKQLKKLWKNKTRHGASRQKFGGHQEMILDDLVKKIVPVKERPLKTRPLKIDGKFSVYCKSITWNAQKSMGKKITREKGFRSGMISLSEFDYLGGQF
jgi:hypothetical protein